MEFRPTKVKIIVSILIGLLIGIFFYYFIRFKSWIPGPGPVELGVLALMIAWLITFIIIYIIISIFQKTKT